MKLDYLLAVASLATSVSAKVTWNKYGDDYFASMGCKTGVEKVARFCGTKQAKGDYKCICTNENALTSFIDCGKTYYSHLDFDTYLDAIAGQCTKSAKAKKIHFTPDYLMDVYNKNVDRIVSVKNVSSPDFQRVNTSYPVTGPAVKKAAHIGYVSYRNRYQNVNVSHYMGIAYLAMVALVLIISGIVNWCERFNIHLTPKFFKKYVTMRLVGKNHLQSNACGLNPDMVETILLVLSFLYSFLCCVVMGFDYLKGDPVFATFQAGTSRYFGDRSGILSAYQTPLLFLFPGRNNFLQYISRWKYSRFVTFHKWLARIIVIEILIHSFAMASQTYALKKWARFDKWWYREGIAATVFACLILCFAAAPVRKRFYELFLYLHILLVVQFLWLTWVHCAFIEYQNYYAACAAIWCFDRFIRLVRITGFGVAQNAEVQYFAAEEIIKVTVPESKLSLLKAYPGAHAFISFLTPTRFWQTHPFTVYPSVEQPGHVHFSCRVKKGLTRYIADRCIANKDGKMSIKIAIDGFYGEQNPYQNYSKAVLITGGTGLSGPFFHAKKLIENNPDKEVKLYWSVRTYQAIESYLPEILSLKDTNVKPIIYVTKPDSIDGTTSASASSDDNKDEKESLGNGAGSGAGDISCLISFADVRHGRMNAAEIVASEVAEANGSIAFGACAHTQVVDEVRRTVADIITTTSHRVDYFEEMQMW